MIVVVLVVGSRVMEPVGTVKASVKAGGTCHITESLLFWKPLDPLLGSAMPSRCQPISVSRLMPRQVSIYLLQLYGS